MSRAYYAAAIEKFLQQDADHIVGTLTRHSEFAVEATQRHAWQTQISILQRILRPYAGEGTVYFEYAVPRVGRRIDTVLLIQGTLLILEFKIGQSEFLSADRDQVWDYALDLKNFHETSHDKVLVPILVATEARARPLQLEKSALDDGVFRPIFANEQTLEAAIQAALTWVPATGMQAEEWEGGRYRPAPTIVEAAMALYAGHGVAEIARFGAEATNLAETSAAVEAVIETCRANSKKAICFVTGVPGAGKTLVGLNVATKHAEAGDLHSVFLSGNGPLVKVLQEALARDHLRREAAAGRQTRKNQAASRVKAFIQNVHHFRDEYLNDTGAPSDHIAVFDEAQRAWDVEQTAAFMQRKKNKSGFSMSEPEFLISCMDRHTDWAVVVCLVGGGQEINTGEGGITEWLSAVNRSFPKWEVHISPELRGDEYSAAALSAELDQVAYLCANQDLHLAVSMRSFKANQVSHFVKQLLDLEQAAARELLRDIATRYPLVLCRSVGRAKRWLKEQARGSERFGLVASSQAQRLRPYAIHVKTPVDPVHWFLHGRDDVRSSYYLEDVATEFHVQGLELDWVGVVWDGDMRRSGKGWEHHSFVGSRWQRVLAPTRQRFQKNAYRVLLTRARQGMVIVVPEGDPEDKTRDPSFYDPTFAYLRDIGIPVLT